MLKVATEALYREKRSQLPLAERSAYMLDGLDIGALHQPMLLPRVRSKYVDSRNLEDLRKHYPELGLYFLSDPDFIASAETLVNVPTNSFDVIIMSHVLEHTRLTLRALRNALNCTRKGGLLYVALPNMCVSVDKFRLQTTWAHHLSEWLDPKAAEKNEHEHYREYSIMHLTVMGMLQSRQLLKEEDVNLHAKEMQLKNYSIHYHTWSPAGYFNYINKAKEVVGMLPFDIVAFGVDTTQITMYALLKKL